MSAIETYLQYIASKVWARDVRTAIVNAIRQCYDDVHNPTLNTEALQAAIQAKIDAGQMAALTIGDRTITAAKLALGVIPTPDTTLSQSGVPADAKKTGDEISALQADLATLADVTPIPDNSDLNDYVNTGLYTIEYGNYTILHYPTDTIVASYLEVTALTTGYIAQKLTQAGTGKVFTRRRYSNGNWNEWIQIQADLEYQAIPTNSDLNNYYEKGKYYIGGNNIVVANFPLPSVQACIIDVNPLSNGLTSQVVTMVSKGTIYTRWRLGNGTWGSWQNLTSSEINKCVRFDTVQTKTEAEKARARANIGVSDSAGLSERAQYMLLRCLRDTASNSEYGGFYVDTFEYALNENMQFVHGLNFVTTSYDDTEVTYIYSFGGTGSIGMFSNDAVNKPFNKYNDSQSNIKAYPIHVPQGAATLTLTKPENLCGVMVACKWDSTNNVWVRKRGFTGEKAAYNTDMSADVSGINDGTYYIVYTFTARNPVTGEVTDLRTIKLTSLGYSFS